MRGRPLRVDPGFAFLNPDLNSVGGAEGSVYAQGALAQEGKRLARRALVLRIVSVHFAVLMIDCAGCPFITAVDCRQSVAKICLMGEPNCPLHAHVVPADRRGFCVVVVV